MKFFVAGGVGFVGSHLVAALLAERHQVIVFDNFSTGKEANLAPLKSPSLEIIHGDITDEPSLQAACLGIDGIFHLAAVVSVQLSIENLSLIKPSAHFN